MLLSFAGNGKIMTEKNRIELYWNGKRYDIEYDVDFNSIMKKISFDDLKIIKEIYSEKYGEISEIFTAFLSYYLVFVFLLQIPEFSDSLPFMVTLPSTKILTKSFMRFIQLYVFSLMKIATHDLFSFLSNVHTFTNVWEQGFEEGEKIPTELYIRLCIEVVNGIVSFKPKEKELSVELPDLYETIRGEMKVMERNLERKIEEKFRIQRSFSNLYF